MQKDPEESVLYLPRGAHACVYAAFVDSNEQSPTDKEEAVSSVELINKKTVFQMVADGLITDGYSLSALAYYWANENGK